MIDFLTNMVMIVGSIAGVMLLYLVKQIYSTNNPYRDD